MQFYKNYKNVTALTEWAQEEWQLGISIDKCCVYIEPR